MSIETSEATTRAVGGGYPVDAPRQIYRWQGHNVAYYSDGDGPPLLLVHSINAAASAFEMRKPFAGLRSRRRVYALEFLGYGGSDRPARAYSANDYATLIGDFARDVIGQQTAVIASSLGAAYTIRAAARNPERFGPLVLICPTGINQLARPAQPGVAYSILRGPVGDALFEGLTTRAGIRLFLGQQAYFDKHSVDDAVVDGFYRAAHQPGGKYAPICFLTQLLNCDVRAEFPQLRQPILIVWGRETTTTPLSEARAFLKRNPAARLEVIDQAKLLVQDEHPEAFNRLASAFLSQSR